MTLLLFGILALGFSIAAFALKEGRRILCWVSAGVWLLLGITGYTYSLVLWDTYYALFLLSMIMVLTFALVPVALREKKEADEVDEFKEENKELIDDIEKSERDRQNYNRLFGKRKKSR